MIGGGRGVGVGYSSGTLGGGDRDGGRANINGVGGREGGEGGQHRRGDV